MGDPWTLEVLRDVLMGIGALALVGALLRLWRLVRRRARQRARAARFLQACALENEHAGKTVPLWRSLPDRPDESGRWRHERLRLWELAQHEPLWRSGYGREGPEPMPPLPAPKEYAS